MIKIQIIHKEMNQLLTKIVILIKQKLILIYVLFLI
jgi:hypothetical protein